MTTRGLADRSRASCVASLALALAVPCACRSPEPTAASHYDCPCSTSLDQPERTERPACLRRVGDVYQMRPEILRSLAGAPGSPLFETDSRCGVFWVRADGRAMPTQNYDNGADYFCDGLARYLIDGKYGYVNAKLEVVVPARYDFAYPFQGGHGAVCRQCTFTPAGEHTSVACAECGAVDTTGKLVLPLRFSADEIMQRFPGSAEVDCPVLAPPN